MKVYRIQSKLNSQFMGRNLSYGSSKKGAVWVGSACKLHIKYFKEFYKERIEEFLIHEYDLDDMSHMIYELKNFIEL